MSSAKVRCRNWTPEETELFANVLADEDNRFTASLEWLASKKTANNKVFDHIKKSLIESEVRRILMTKNEERNFCNKNGDLQRYSPLWYIVNKLRRKYTSLKAEWRKILDMAKLGRGLVPEKWYKILNPVFTETNEDLEITGHSAVFPFSWKKAMIKVASLRRNLPILVVLIMKIYPEMKKLLVVLGVSVCTT